MRNGLLFVSIVSLAAVAAPARAQDSGQDRPRIEELRRRVRERLGQRIEQELKLSPDQMSRLRATVGDGVLLHPPAPGVSPRHGHTVARLWWIHPMIAFNLAGLPVTQVPLGLDRRGLPLGVQVVAGHGRDHLTIRVARELERAFGGWTPPPRFTR